RQQARNLRARKWSASTIAQRLSSDAKWAGQFAEAQQQLPARQFRAHIDAALADHQVTIVRGETGSGKSSQVPQFALAQLLAQASYTGGRILCTQPRRISTTAIATRVSQELGDTAPGSSDGLVGYQIRFDARAHDANALVFCTTGVLLRMLADDPELNDVACIICDEVQERTLELDYLLIAMRQLIKRRRGALRLVLMSATIDTGVFARYFGGCPVVDIPGRTFPVQSVFLENVVQMSGYALEPGSRYETADAGPEVAGLDLDRAGPGLDLDPQPGADAVDPAFVSPRAWAVVSRMRADTVNLDLVCHVLAGICGTGDAHSHSAWARFSRSAVPHGAVLVFLPGIREIRALCGMLSSGGSRPLRASVIPLHSAFAGDRPAGSSMTYTELAFAPAEAGRRKIILATNVAETGITIPDVTVVVDCGLANQAVWDRARH
ncbi:ATP-dependent RNA helicase dhx29, partial [Kickxella alabastrina]